MKEHFEDDSSEKGDSGIKAEAEDQENGGEGEQGKQEQTELPPAAESLLKKLGGNAKGVRDEISRLCESSEALKDVSDSLIKAAVVMLPLVVAMAFDAASGSLNIGDAKSIMAVEGLLTIGAGLAQDASIGKRNNAKLLVDALATNPGELAKMAKGGEQREHLRRLGMSEEQIATLAGRNEKGE